MNANVGFTPNKGSLVTLLLCSMLFIMGGAAVAPALPAINQVFAGQDFAVSLIITLPSLSVAIAGFILGALADRYGKVRVLVTSLTLFTLSGVASFFLNDLTVILVMRFFVGVGIAGITSTVSALIAEYYTGMERAKVMSYQAAATGIGVLVLEYTGGSLVEYGWNVPFLVYLIGIPMVILAILFLREPFHDDAVHVVRESNRTANKRIIIVCYLATFILMLMAFLMPTKMTFFLNTVGVSASMVGLLLGVHGVINAVVCLMYRRLVSVFNPFMLMGLGFLLWGVSLEMLILSPTATTAVMVLIVSGVGMGLMTPAITNTLATEATSSTSGKVMGGYSVSLNMGQFSISLLSVPLLALAGDSYPMMFSIIGVLAFAMAAVFIVYCMACGKVKAL